MASLRLGVGHEQRLAGHLEVTDKLLAMLDDPKNERRKIWTAYTFLTWHEQFFEKFDA